MFNARRRRRSLQRWSVVIVQCALSMAAVSCEREARPFRELPVAAARTGRPGVSLQAGGPAPSPPQISPFQRNAWGILEGKHIYDNFNCVGCHAHGGGGMGPALMDDKWIYGSQPANMFESIVEGRPNGMPSFRNRIADVQVWQLVAYIQSLSGQVAMDASAARSDHLQAQRP